MGKYFPEQRMSANVGKNVYLHKWQFEVCSAERVKIKFYIFRATVSQKPNRPWRLWRVIKRKWMEGNRRKNQHRNFTNFKNQLFAKISYTIGNVNSIKKERHISETSVSFNEFHSIYCIHYFIRSIQYSFLGMECINLIYHFTSHVVTIAR